MSKYWHCRACDAEHPVSYAFCPHTGTAQKESSSLAQTLFVEHYKSCVTALTLTGEQNPDLNRAADAALAMTKQVMTRVKGRL